MPNRTPEARKMIDSLPIKEPDTMCRARTASGYCKMPAGFRTDHVGNGRCYLHGGRAGKPISHGLYSKKLKSTLKDEYDKMVNDPALVDLYAEFALTKSLMMNFIDSIQENIDNSVNIWVSSNRFGEDVLSPQAKALISMLETISRIFTRITDAETKTKNTLNMKQVYAIVTQIKNALNDTCGECPVRHSLGDRLKSLKAPNMDEQ
jgi:hypothetical protein